MVRRRGSPGFTLIELLVVVAIIALLVSILLPSLGKAREQAKKSFCANNLGQFGRATHIYVGEYKYFPPQSPYPQYMSSRIVGPSKLQTFGWDPCIGWLMTHAMRMTPPRVDTLGIGHFMWFMLSEDELPDIVVCPAAKRELMFQFNPEINAGSLESFLYQYAAFYLTSGTCRSPTTIIRQRKGTQPGLGGANPPIPDPTNGTVSGQPWDNGQNGVPYVWVQPHDGAVAADVNQARGNEEYQCFVQAVESSQIDNPGRVFYLGDGREYRPVPGGWPAATKFDGWGAGYGNQIFIGTRHSGFANMVYMDGHCNSDNQRHYPTWNLAYTGDPKDIRSDTWRVATFADEVRYANVRTQNHHMPQLMVRGWEWFFTSLGQR